MNREGVWGSEFGVRSSEFGVWGSGFVLVVVLVLDLWDFGAEKRARSFGNYFVLSL
ncbi:MAG: hypothetical protein JO070_10345 [Verrucomicrobia bacterium]|nr:hypothetical protein [Verrucomicrobiota bacterium]